MVNEMIWIGKVEGVRCATVCLQLLLVCFSKVVCGTVVQESKPLEVCVEGAVG